MKKWIWELFLSLVALAMIVGGIYFALISGEVDPWRGKLYFSAGLANFVIGILLCAVFVFRLCMVCRHLMYERRKIGIGLASVGIIIGLVASKFDSPESITALGHAFVIFGIGMMLVGIILFFPAIKYRRF